MTTETPTVRVWRPKLAAAERERNRARQRLNFADARLKDKQHNRNRQTLREQDLARDGLEPYYLTPATSLGEMALHQERLVRWHVTEQELEQAELALELCKAELDDAEASFEKARKVPPITDAQIRKAATGKARYMALKHLKIDGQDYDPGDIIRDAVIDSLPYTKIEQWQYGNVPTIRKL
jgi:hypothetical protein